VIDGQEIAVQGEFALPLAELREAHETAIPALLG
jgi:phosphoribosylformylglycinamidine synthase